MFKRLLASPLVQIVLCVAAYLAVTWRMGPTAMVISSPLLGAAIALPLINLACGLRHRARAATWLPVHGKHYVFRGVTINVIEDDDYCRWLRLADARKVFPISATERVLAISFPDRVKSFGNARDAYLRDDAMIELLARQTDATALRFRTWIDRTIFMPGQKVRSDRGIRPEPPVTA
ncbi:hypothetical protein [Caenimonas koreensis]|uniref:Uncharacterized protein n=1 Tax=Caenimonas koreensis DSM 17982 TaxID=1121255 RepID=A0A844B4Y5_9BURK|nr:hypothetical protein [Caenimonas koreensis]MRD46356.1 hypothetical protein [Caenimonas koreensis DSM 17982]